MFRKPLLKEPVRSLAGRRVQWNIAKLLGRRIESSNSTLHGRLWLRKRRLKNAKLWFRNLCHNHAKIWFLKGRRTAEAKTKSKAPSQSSCLGRYINQRWTDILIFEGIMDRFLYIDEILGSSSYLTSIAFSLKVQSPIPARQWPETQK